MPRQSTHLLLRLVLSAILAVVAWYVLSLIHTGDLAAPGQPIFVGQPWMRPPRPTSTPWPTPASMPTPIPLPTPTSTPVSMPAPTPDARIRALVEENGFDPAGRFIVVDQDRQRMMVVEDGVIVADLPVSTGDPDRGYRTPAWVGRVGEYWGTFSASGVSADEAWFLFKDGGSILIHGAPYVVEDGVKKYKEMYALGTFPASRGCIRLHPEDAEWFTRWGPYNVPIIILPWTRGPAQG